MELLSLIGLKIIVFLFSITPFWLLFRISDGFAFIMRKVIRYRLEVVRKNLRQSFPEKTEQELLTIEKKFYVNLSDLLLESIKGLSMSKKALRKRMHFKNPEVLEKVIAEQKSILGGSSHIGNWEWTAVSMGFWMSIPAIGIYKPIKNKKIDRYIKRKRNRFGLQLIPMAETRKAIALSRGKSHFFILYSDQTPSNPQKAHWIHFLHQDTPFLYGLDKISRRTGNPVYYFDIQRVKRGYYELTFSELCGDPSGMKEGEITQLYVEKLEAIIQNDPANWLWSHKRWKYGRNSLQ